MLTILVKKLAGFFHLNFVIIFSYLKSKNHPCFVQFFRRKDFKTFNIDPLVSVLFAS
jgi:hypothetical protein